MVACQLFPNASTPETLHSPFVFANGLTNRISSETRPAFRKAQKACIAVETHSPASFSWTTCIRLNQSTPNSAPRPCTAWVNASIEHPLAGCTASSTPTTNTRAPHNNHPAVSGTWCAAHADVNASIAAWTDPASDSDSTRSAT